MPSSSKVMNVFSSAVSNREDFFLCIEFLLQKHRKQENLRSFLLLFSSMSNFKNIRNKVGKSVLRSSQLNKLFYRTSTRAEKCTCW